MLLEGDGVLEFYFCLSVIYEDKHPMNTTQQLHSTPSRCHLLNTLISILQ